MDKKMYKDIIGIESFWEWIKYCMWALIMVCRHILKNDWNMRDIMMRQLTLI